MKINYKKAFGFLVTIISIIAIGHTAFSVKAIDINPNDLEEKPIENVSRKQCNIVTADDRYKAKVTVPDDLNANYFTVSVKNGSFDVYVYEILNDDNGNSWPELRNNFVLGEGSNKSVQVNVTKGAAPKHYEVVFNLNKADDLCGVVEGSKPVRASNGSWNLANNQIGYVYYYQVDIAANQSTSKIQNINYNGICSTLRTGNYDSYSSQFQKAGLSREDFINYATQARSRIPYCDSQYVEINYTEAEIAMLIRNAIAGIKISEMGTNGNLTGPPVSEDLTIVGQEESTDFSSGDKALQCPAYQTVNGVQIPNQSATVKKYYKKVITNTEYDVYDTIPGNDATCQKTCEETVTVSYGPPVASKAGLCFEYKVKVESKLNCVTEFLGEEPTPDDYKVCTPVGGCNGGALRSASGPNEDFDSCVNACDGGNYTQSCIDSCYKEVYDINNTLPLSYMNKMMEINAVTSNKSKVEQLATEEEMKRYYDILDSGPDNVGPGKKYSYDDLKVAITEAGSGYYYVKGSIRWQPGTRYWERPGRYYTVNATEYTVNRLKSAGRYNSSWNQSGLSIVDKVGFLRNNYGSSICGAACSWGGCEDARRNGYYKGFVSPGNSTTSATTRQFLNSEDAIDVYKKEFVRYEAAVKECKAEATCSTKTTEFTIKVNNKTNADPNTDNWIDYATSINNGHLAGTTINGAPLTNNSIILDRSGCYGEIIPDGNSYMTEWSFPGTWINNKTGKISYKPQGDNAWHVKKEKFCTNLDSKYVNTDWWTQRILQPNTPVADSDKATIEEYNIEATTKDFGYFEWDFKINCFYALYDNPIPNDSSNNDDANEALAHTTRTVSLSDIFPNSENETITNDPNETGRTPGYNWTNEASNLKNLEYEVTPGALYSAIQARGNEIYNNQDMYLDYEFYLSPADLNTIRKYSKEAGGNYSNYQGKIRVANGIAYYESALFRNSITTSTNKLSPNSIITLGALGVNNQERKGSNIAETFENTYTAILKQNREEYLKSLSGGKE